MLTASQKLRYFKDFRIYKPEPEKVEVNRKFGNRCYTVADKRHTVPVLHKLPL